jgi:hypothetical protein
MAAGDRMVRVGEALEVGVAEVISVTHTPSRSDEVRKVRATINPGVSKERDLRLLRTSQCLKASASESRKETRASYRHL